MWREKDFLSKNPCGAPGCGEQTPDARGEGVGRLDEKGKGIKGTNWQLQNSPGDAQHRTGNSVNNIAITIVSMVLGGCWNIL